ncbi:MAG TPA: hypothetical protein VE978_03620 [Chitinophagales bacterium]|nr:hypothetical protein [Chitinophagales bacterium]
MKKILTIIFLFIYSHSISQSNFDSASTYQVLNLHLKYADKQMKGTYFLRECSLNADTFFQKEIGSGNYAFCFPGKKIIWDSSLLNSKYMKVISDSERINENYYSARITIPWFDEQKTTCVFFMNSGCTLMGLWKTKKFTYKFRRGEWHLKKNELISWLRFGPSF